MNNKEILNKMIKQKDKLEEMREIIEVYSNKCPTELGLEVKNCLYINGDVDCFECWRKALSEYEKITKPVEKGDVFLINNDYYIMVSPDPFALRLIGLETANIWSRDNYSNWLINDIIDSIKNEGFKIKYLPKGIKIKEI